MNGIEKRYNWHWPSVILYLVTILHIVLLSSSSHIYSRHYWIWLTFCLLPLCERSMSFVCACVMSMRMYAIRTHRQKGNFSNAAYWSRHFFWLMHWKWFSLNLILCFSSESNNRLQQSSQERIQTISSTEVIEILTAHRSMKSNWVFFPLCEFQSHIENASFDSIGAKIGQWFKSYIRFFAAFLRKWLKWRF